jgi:GntR family transcriptional regulator/MocR family aminotransferase
MLVHAVMEGFLSPGEALPSSRLLGQMLDLSRTTVTLALQALADKGLIVGKPRSGYYVSHELQATYIGARQRSSEPPSANSVHWCNRLKSKPSIQRNIHKPTNWQRYPYPFIYGQFDSTLFPNADWRECVLESSQTRGLRRWAPDSIDQDDDSLVEQIHRRLLPARGIWAEPDQILVTAGAQQAMFLLTMLLMGPNTVVGVENPGYPDARNTLALRTKQVRALKIDQFGLCVTPNLSQCQYVYVTPSHQCPTTVTMPLERRMELLDRAV